MASTPPNAPAADEQEVEVVDDPDLRASLDEPAPHDADKVMDAIDHMIEAIARAVA
ncbi:MAG TPA: hypothetical protein VFS43_21225 [Polyangiaceae bacterium]|nr:hypothetical protein [Polyangiaceae bacterium]